LGLEQRGFDIDAVGARVFTNCGATTGIDAHVSLNVVIFCFAAPSRFLIHNSGACVVVSPT
jgi:hypothetical protein